MHINMTRKKTIKNKKDRSEINLQKVPMLALQ